MTRVPLAERRRLFLARQRADQALRDEPLQAGRSHPSHAEASDDYIRLVVKAVMIAVLVGLGLVAFQTVTFNPPTSIVDALLPPV